MSTSSNNNAIRKRDYIYFVLFAPVYFIVGAIDWIHEKIHKKPPQNTSQQES